MQHTSVLTQQVLFAKLTHSTVTVPHPLIVTRMSDRERTCRLIKRSCRSEQVDWAVSLPSSNHHMSYGAQFIDGWQKKVPRTRWSNTM